MWNYSYILPSMMILLIFLLYYFLRPRLPVRMNRTFVVLLLVDFGTILFDYISTKVDEAYMNFSVPGLYVANMVFFVFFMARPFYFAQFNFDVLEDHGPLPSFFRRSIQILCIAVELITLSSVLTGAIFYVDDTGYHSGSLYILLTIYMLLTFGISLAACLHHTKRIPPRMLAVLLAAILILLAGCIIRFMMPQILIMDTFCLMAIIILFLTFQNPDFFLTHERSAFNQIAFQLLLNEWHGKKRYRILGFVLHDFNEYRGIYGNAQVNRIIDQINRYLKNMFPTAEVFYLEKGRFALLNNEKMNFEGTIDTIRTRFRQPWDTEAGPIGFEISFAEFDSEDYASSVDWIISIFLIALENKGRLAETADYSDDRSEISHINEELAGKQALDRALAEDALEVFLQPIVEASTGRIVSAEALARIRDGNGRVIPPAVFIPIAEKDGQISLLGEQMFRKVCALEREHDLEALGLNRINVNLSPYQLASKDLVQRFNDILLEHQVSHQQVLLEITEDSIVDYALLHRQIQSMRNSGFHFVLDDYGSGYSNMIRLRQYPFENIKLDMEIVWDYCHSSFSLLPAFIRSVKEMGLTVTAEGIQDESMARTMTQLGCDYLQGFLYSEPLPVEEFFALLKSRS